MSLYWQRLERLRVLLGQRLRSERKRLGISQEELARRAGLDRTYVSKIERGERNVTLSTVEKLADALKVNPSELLNGRRR